MNQLSVQDALSKIDEYNAAIELPFTALVGLRAASAEPPARDENLAKRELSASISICQALKQALSEEDTSPQGLTLASAFRSIFPERSEQEELLPLLSEAISVLSAVLTQLQSGSTSRTPSLDEIVALEGKLRALRDRIRQEIPRDTYLSSISGGVFRGQRASAT